MPLFDFRCSDCRKKFTLLVGVVAERQDEKCPACGSANVNKLVSRFARLRSEDDLIDDLADPSKMGDLENPKELHSWMKRMGKEMGEDLGDDFDEMLDESASGIDEVTEDEP
jgi:putative FmdB family regulatory protein